VVRQSVQNAVRAAAAPRPAPLNSCVLAGTAGGFVCCKVQLCIACRVTHRVSQLNICRAMNIESQVGDTGSEHSDDEANVTIGGSYSSRRTTVVRSMGAAATHGQPTRPKTALVNSRTTLLMLDGQVIQ
jgi:hypothetical protein